MGGSKFWDGVDAVMKEREKARKEEATLIKLEREKRRRRIRRRRAELHIENEKRKEKLQEEGKYICSCLSFCQAPLVCPMLGRWRTTRVLMSKGGISEIIIL